MPNSNTSTLPSLSQLNDVFLIHLPHMSAITLSGEEQSKYLQGQVTCDVESLAEQHILTGAHCNAKGKVFSVFRLFNSQSAHLLFQTKASIESSLTELKKFGVFAKVSISEADTLDYYALGGKNASQILKQSFEQIPDSLTPVITIDTLSLIYIAGKQTRYLLIDEKEKLATCINHLKTNIEIDLTTYPEQVWDLLEIVEGFPQLTQVSSGEYVPQMLNVDKINGISFTKGCYLGQETVARMQYLGKNKRALYALSTQLTNKLDEEVCIEKQLGENWRKAGDVLSFYQASDGNCYIQAVLNNDSNENKLQIKSQENSQLTILELPYTLT